MDYKRVEHLLNRYDSGQSTNQEQEELRLFFMQEEIPEHWMPYKMMFTFFHSEQQSQSSKIFSPPSTKRNYSWIKAAAAVLFLGLFTQQYLAYQQKRKAQVAFDQTLEILNLVSEQMTKGTAKLSYIKTFSETTNQFLKQ